MMKKWYVDIGVSPDTGEKQYWFMNDMDNPTYCETYYTLDHALAVNSPCEIVWLPKVRRRMREVMEMNAELP